MTRPRIVRGVAASIVVLWLAACVPDSPSTDQGAVGGIQAPGPLAAALDSAAHAHVDAAMVPGVSVGVVRGDETLLHRGYGFVDLEWDVPTPADGSASYEIGSVTKQFTAAAILLLAEEGAVDLDADVTEYVDFDTGGRRVPVRRLLDHTSGIRGYTEMEIFGELTPFELPRDTLLRLVEAEPFDFEPGGAQIYNNSAYFLLGLVIEEASGMSYEAFVAERLFGPAGMEGSYYCDELALRDGRAHGYDAAAPDSLIRARYLDHTWPYAAGSLCSTAGDLVAWNRALHGGDLLSVVSYEAMTTPAPLADGTPIRYAMGVAVDSVGEHPVLAHGGGINGFVSQLSYYPDEELTIVVLQNSAAAPGAGALAGELAELVLGAPGEPEAVPFEGDLDALVGTYRGPARGQPLEVRVSVEDGALAVRVPFFGEDAVQPVHRGGLQWDEGGVRMTFVAEGDGIGQLRFDHRSGHYVLERVEG